MSKLGLEAAPPGFVLIFCKYIIHYGLDGSTVKQDVFVSYTYVMAACLHREICWD